MERPAGVAAAVARLWRRPLAVRGGCLLGRGTEGVLAAAEGGVAAAQSAPAVRSHQADQQRKPCIHKSHV